MDRPKLTYDEYLSGLKKKNNNTWSGHKSVINHFVTFRDKNNIDNIEKDPLRVLRSFIEYLEIKELGGRTINLYLIRMKRILRVCHGVRLDAEDFKDFLDLPEIDEEEAEPLERNELRLILQNTRSARRRALYWFIGTTAARIAEALQVRVNMIDFTQDPPLVTLPKGIVKGKTRTRYQYLSKENAPLIKQICSKLGNNDLVFTDQEIVQFAKNNERKAWIVVIEGLGLNEKYEISGHYKKNFHSIRAFVSTEIYNNIRDAEYAHAYLGHDTYLKQYLRKSPDVRAKMFREIEGFLRIFGEVIQNPQQKKLDAIELTLKMALTEIKILQAEKEPAV